MTFFKSQLHAGRRAGSFVILAALAALMTGCMTAKQYVDPQLPKVSLSDLKPAVDKKTVQLFYEFKTNGAFNAKVTESSRELILDNLKKSNLFNDIVVAPTVAERKLFVTINNIPMTKDSASKGYMAGLTLGAAGTLVTDGYQMDAAYDAPGRAEIKHSYQHALHTTIGNADGPAGLEPVPQGQGIKLIFDGLMMNLLRDMSNQGELQ